LTDLFSIAIRFSRANSLSLFLSFLKNSNQLSKAMDEVSTEEEARIARHQFIYNLLNPTAWNLRRGLSEWEIASIPMTTEVPNDAKCSICLDDIKGSAQVLKCSHLFHKNCIVTWLNQNKSCPYCRCQLQGVQRLHQEIAVSIPEGEPSAENFMIALIDKFYFTTF
jgi:hypothetical protein